MSNSGWSSSHMLNSKLLSGVSVWAYTRLSYGSSGRRGGLGFSFFCLLGYNLNQKVVQSGGDVYPQFSGLFYEFFAGANGKNVVPGPALFDEILHANRCITFALRF
jgi:hypothetical protein